MLRVMTIAVVLVFALMGASCGGDSETASDTDTVVTETTDDTTTDETTTDDDGSFATGDCASLVAAATSVSQAFSGTGDAEGVEEARAEFEEFAENAPDEISDDLQVLADAYDEFADILDDAGFEPGETPTAEAIAELQAAIAAIDQVEVTEAAANVNAWTTANC